MSTTTALHNFHIRHDAHLVTFAGVTLPLYYKQLGMKNEHLHSRHAASIFDVSHMGQVRMTGDETLTDALSYLVTADLTTLQTDRMVYTTLTNETGGVIDDCIITKQQTGFSAVLNASRKAVDIAHLEQRLPNATITELKAQALIAFQGPKAAAILAHYDNEIAVMPFMSSKETTIDGISCLVSRCGYTGEDGFELSVANDSAEQLAERLLQHTDVHPAGLAARDSLRLEAGLCLYGNELNETISPISAGLTWSIARTKRKIGSFLGSETIVPQIGNPTTKLIGLLVSGKIAARSHAKVLHQGTAVGSVTSGVYAPSLSNQPIAMAFVTAAAANEKTLAIEIRNATVSATVTSLPFVAHNYYK